MLDYKPYEDGNVITDGLKEFFSDDNAPATTWIGVSSLAMKGEKAADLIKATARFPQDESLIIGDSMT